MKTLKLNYLNSRRNNLEIHGIPTEVKDNQLEEKVMHIFSQLNISLSKSDIEDCHRLGKSNTIVRFVNQKFCKDVLEKKFDVNKRIDNSKFGFNVENKLFVCKNLTPYNQHLAWMCRELKRRKKIYNSWASQRIIKLKRTINEQPISIDYESEIKSLYPDCF